MLPAWLSARTSCPANPAEKELVEECFLLLRQRLGFNRLRDAKVIEPTPAFFPDRYDASLETAANLFAHVCEYMGVKAKSIDLRFWQDEGQISPSLALGAINSKGASGYYSQSEEAECVSINVKELQDPEGLISTMAHELAHVLLLGGDLISADHPHMEALTDLATIYLGLGIFTSNTLLRRHGWTYGNLEGWRVSRKGYISPEMAGWGLSLFACARGEKNPSWRKYLATDGSSYLKQGLRYLEQTSDSKFITDALGSTSFNRP